jgi:NAD+ kinase
MNIRSVRFISHPSKPGIADIERELTSLLQEQGVDVEADEPDLVISLGGDGTMLRAAQEAHEHDVPILGINRGMLGYMTEVEAGDEVSALKRMFAGDFELEERMMLGCTMDLGGSSYVGLNEVLVERSLRHRMIRLDVRIDGERLAEFDADGLIVATPTGSTAYALSAGGPIVDPKAQCMVLVPVSAHLIFARPLVLSADAVVELRVLGSHEDASLTIDGRLGGPMPPDAAIVVRKHPRPLRFVKISGPGFLERLRAKLQLPG